jgi:hypothetical protein
LHDKTSKLFHGTQREIKLYDLEIGEFVDFAEAWENLDLFSPEAGLHIEQIYSALRSLAKFLKSQPPNMRWVIAPDTPYSLQMKVVNDAAGDLHTASLAVLKELHPVITALRSELES